MNFLNPYSRNEYKEFFQNRFLTNNFKIIEEKLPLEFTPGYIKSAELIGRDKFLELEVYEVTHNSGQDPRVGLSKDIFRLMSSYGSKRSLVLLSTPKSPNYRLSLATIDLSLEGSKVIREYSNPRRFSFLLGPGAKAKTAYEFLITKGGIRDFEDLKKRFSIEAVTDDFYNQFKPNFELIAESVKGTKNSDLKKDFALLFIIRSIFLGFVQKKMWLNKDEEFILNFWKEYKSKYSTRNLFYSEWMRPLFFDSLNYPPGRKVFNRTTPFSKETALALQMAPYLNGELFKEKPGFDDMDLYIPDKSIEIFFDFIFSYNFTIEENTLYDQDLELNPEFLGIIFERLVNKEDGAVYTPRTEVDFMCRISLVKWLEKNSSINKKKLYHLFFDKINDNSKDSSVSNDEKEEILSNLKTVTICDPAAGSGAFPVGMLQVLDEVISTLSENNTTTVFERKKEIISRSLYGVEVKTWAVWINQLRLWLSLFIDMPDEFKSSFEPLLPNLEFKVRRGDSLVQQIGNKIFPVESQANISPELKRKITELKKDKTNFFFGKGRYDSDMIRKKESDIFTSILEEQILTKKNTLNNLGGTVAHEDLFGNKVQKEQLQLEIDEKKREQLKEEIKILKDELISFKDEHPLIWNIEFAEIFYDRKGFDIIIGNPPYVRQEKLSDPSGKFKPTVYKELLRTTIYEEYPEYFFEDRNKGSLRNKIDGKSDLFTFFYLKSLKLLNSRGIHTFICSNSWLDVGYGTWLQKFILENVKLQYIIDNQAKRSFSSADVNTIISVMDAPGTKTNEAHKTKFIVYKKSFDEALNTENLLLVEYAETVIKDDDFRVYPVSYKELKHAGSVYENEEAQKLDFGIYEGDKWGGKYLRAPDIFFTILDKGKDKLVRFGDVTEVRRGFTTGANEFFYLTKNVINQWGIEKEYLKPVIKSPRESKDIKIKFNDLESKILICNKTKTQLNSTNLIKYINWGEKQKTKDGVSWNSVPSVTGRKLWYEIDENDTADYIIPRTFNDIYLCYYGGVNHSDRFYGLYCNKRNLLMYLNSTLFIFLAESLAKQSLGLGALDLNIRELVKIPVLIDFPKAIGIKREMKSVFEELGFDKTKTIRYQQPNPLPDRKALDDIIFDALGLTNSERKEVYWATAEMVKNRLDKAKSV